MYTRTNYITVYEYLYCHITGYGKSSEGEPGDKADFLQELLLKLEATKPILISPSMSGSYSIPFVIKYPQALGGFVPIAPVGTEKLKANAQELMVCSVA